MSFKLPKRLGLAVAALLALPLYAYADHHPDHEAVESASTSAAPPDGVTVRDCWIRAMPSRLPSAAYFRVSNAGAHDAVLVAARAQGFDRVMLHTHQSGHGMATMTHVERVVIPAGGGIDFAPRGNHVMLEKPTIDLKVGEQRPIQLLFEGGGALTADCSVLPPSTLK